VRQKNLLCLLNQLLTRHQLLINPWWCPHAVAIKSTTMLTPNISHPLNPWVDLNPQPKWQTVISTSPNRWQHRTYLHAKAISRPPISNNLHRTCNQSKIRILSWRPKAPLSSWSPTCPARRSSRWMHLLPKSKRSSINLSYRRSSATISFNLCSGMQATQCWREARN
jgi:hypothetical protein